MGEDAGEEGALGRGEARRKCVVCAGGVFGAGGCCGGGGDLVEGYVGVGAIAAWCWNEAGEFVVGARAGDGTYNL